MSIGRISRAHLIGATLLLVGLLAAGCSSGSSSTTSSSPAPTAPGSSGAVAATGGGSNGGELTVAIPNISPPFNASTQSNSALRITSNIFDPLIFKDPSTGTLSPGLATAWKQTGPTVWDITVRQGVKFSDGTPMTADDVAFTLSSQRLWGPKALEPSTLASTFTDVKATGATTVQITTKETDPALLDRLASPIGFVVPKAYVLKVGIDKFGVAPVGTGPYMVKGLTPGDHVTLVPNANYWGPKPTYRQVTFREVPEVAARVSGLATGEYQIAATIPPDQQQPIKSNGQQIASVQVDNVVELAFMTNQKGAPTANPLVRQAMELAIDRKSINNSLWAGLVDVPEGFNLPLYKDFYDKKLPVVGQDQSKAKVLLAQAGYSGQTIDLQYISNYYANFDQAVEAMLPMWKAVGLNVKLDPVADYSLLDYKKLNIYATSSNVLLSDPISPLWTDWISPSAHYVKSGRYAPSAQMSAAGQTLAASADAAARKQAFRTIATLWTTEVPSISLWQPVEIDGVAKGINFTPDPRYWMRFAPVPTN